MAVLNVHQRPLPVAPAEAGALIDTLACPTDRLWPHSRWPAMAFDRPLGPGFHEYSVPTQDGRTVLRHTLAMHLRGPARLTWPLVFRPMHNALIEDSLDRAEQAATGTVARPARWSRYLRLLRWCAQRTT